MSTLYHIPQKVNALNLANAACNEHAPKVIALLKNWIGKKIALSSDARTAKFAAEYSKLNLPNNPSVRVRLNSKYNYSIWLYVLGSVYGENHGDYQNVDANALVGYVKDGILETVYDYEPKKYNWTAAEVEQSLLELRLLENKCDEIKKEIPFTL